MTFVERENARICEDNGFDPVEFGAALQRAEDRISAANELPDYYGQDMVPLDPNFNPVIDFIVKAIIYGGAVILFVLASGGAR